MHGTWPAALASVTALALPAVAEVTLYPAPPGEAASEDYAVTVNGRPCFCYTSYRFDTDSSANIQGRPVSPVSFCYFDSDAPTEVEVRMLDGLHRASVGCASVVVRPLALGIVPQVVVEDCFSHNADDSLEVKVWIPQRNVLFRNCVVWNDAGQSLGLACETDADIENVAFENCTVLHSTDDIAARGVIGLHLVGQGSARGFRFENITVEDVRGPRRPALKVFNNWDDWHLNHPTRPDSPYELLEPPARTKPNGTIRDVVFRKVKVLQSKNPDVVVMADSEASRVEDVAVNGRALTPGDPRLKTNAWPRDVVIRR